MCVHLEKKGCLKMSCAKLKILQIASEIKPLHYGYKLSRLSKGPNMLIYLAPVDDGKAVIYFYNTANAPGTGNII